MVGKRKAAPPKTSLRGQHLKRENKKLEKIQPAEIRVDNIISPELKHINIGNYQKDGKKPKNTKNGETAKEKIYREAINHNGMGNIKQEESKQKKTALSFSIKENKKKKEKKTQINPSPVISEETHVRLIENNTVSDLSTLQSQYNSNNYWPSLQEKVMIDNEATLNMIEQYVKNDLFHRLKFISSPEMVMYSKDSRSLCQVACNKFNVDKQDQIRFWAMYSKYIPKFLNKKRSDVSNGVKKQFQCKIPL